MEKTEPTHSKRRMLKPEASVSETSTRLPSSRALFRWDAFGALSMFRRSSAEVRGAFLCCTAALAQHRPSPSPPDPRFDVTSGTYNEDLFRSAYAFLDEYREDEAKQLRQAARVATDAEERETAKSALSRLQQQRTEEARKAASRTALREHKREVAARVAAGHKPYFPKRSELKEIAAASRFNALEERGGAAAVDRALAKRRKKLAGRSKAAMPTAGPPTARRGIPEG